MVTILHNKMPKITQAYIIHHFLIRKSKRQVQLSHHWQFWSLVADQVTVCGKHSATIAWVLLTRWYIFLIKSRLNWFLLMLLNQYPVVNHEIAFRKIITRINWLGYTLNSLFASLLSFSDLTIFHLHLLYQPCAGYVKLHVIHHTRDCQGQQ